jgi:hypothetical protein
MTEATTTLAGPGQETAVDAEKTIRPLDVLTTLVLLLLTPMFLCAADGDVSLARRAAYQTLVSYRVRSQLDLIAVAQIIACGLAALGSLSMSLSDGISLPMMLRLQGSANALNRSAELNRRAIRESHASLTQSEPKSTAAGAGKPMPSPTNAGTAVAPDPAVGTTVAPDPAADARYEEAALASVADTRKRVAEAQSDLTEAASAARPDRAANQPAGQATTAADIALDERRSRVKWATAMVDVAGEYAAELPRLGEPERKMTAMRITALTESARTLLSSKVLSRPAPGALADIMQQNPP